MSDTNQERKSAVREAWKNERGYVREGSGTRDWSQTEQRQIVSKGRANGYEGHHMKSVKEYPQYAGDPQNIQFLNRSEHINGAHKGNTQNATNGYYNPKTGTMQTFGNRAPQAPQSQALSAPIMKNAANQTTANKGIESMRSQAVKTQSAASADSARSSHNKGIETARQKATVKQAGTNTGRSTNQGIKSYQSKVNGQPGSSSKSSASHTAKGANGSAGKPSGSSQSR